MARALRFALRDSVLVAVTAFLWWLDAAARDAAPSLASQGLAVLTGLATAGVGFLLHEWGHLFGAWLARSRVEFPSRLSSVFLFRFDVVHNGRREFLAMSYGGYVASVIGVAALVYTLPRDTLSGQVALLGGVLGVLATLALELPTTVRVFRGAPLPAEGVVYVSTPPPGS